MTDNLSPSPHYFNALKFPTGDVIAAADPAEPFADLSLSFLGLTYSSGMPASASDYIDAETDFTYSLDAARMHALPQYGDRVYGRLVTYPDGRRSSSTGSSTTTIRRTSAVSSRARLESTRVTGKVSSY